MSISWLPTGCHCQHHRSNNNPRTRGDFFYLNSLRRVLFYGANDGSCYQCHLSLSPRGY
ncbi:hypothetical protein CJD53_002641 [Salmonella enterica subsp. enterica serovar Tucson]|nr:hypothetical protein [Salmonella enterica subsp. enterica serovar Tucson]